MQRVMQRDQNSHLAPAPLYHSGRIAATPFMDPNHFPSRLHEMLREISNDGNGHAKIVNWQSHGKCFLIKDKDKFIEKVLPKWFCRLKFTTFERQLHKHGFRKLSRRGPDQGAYYHPKFIREMPEMAKTIQHTNIKGKRGRKPKSKLTEPDFYNTDPNPSSAAGTPEVDRLFGIEGRMGGMRSAARSSFAASSPSTQLRLDRTSHQHRTPATFPRAASRHSQHSSPFNLQAKGNAALFGDTSFAADDLQASTRTGASRANQSLLSSGMQNDSLSSASMSAYLQQQQYQQQQLSGSSLLRNSASAAGTGDDSFSVPQLGRQSSDSFLGSGLLFGGLGDSPQDELGNSSFASLNLQDTLASSAGASSSQQLPGYQDHQERINDLIFRNQQQQRSLQMQQQQLEQQRLELQLRQQQQQDFSTGWQAGMGMGQIAGSSSSSNPLASSSFLLAGQQQQLQQYQDHLMNQQMGLSSSPQQQLQQLQGQGQGLGGLGGLDQDQGQGQGDNNPFSQHFRYNNPNL